MPVGPLSLQNTNLKMEELKEHVLFMRDVCSLESNDVDWLEMSSTLRHKYLTLRHNHVVLREKCDVITRPKTYQKQVDVELNAHKLLMKLEHGFSVIHLLMGLWTRVTVTVGIPPWVERDIAFKKKVHLKTAEEAIAALEKLESIPYPSPPKEVVYCDFDLVKNPFEDDEIEALKKKNEDDEKIVLSSEGPQKKRRRRVDREEYIDPFFLGGR